jgi:hypothetical protein
VLAQRYNFDDYSSKGSTVHPAKKYHYKAAAVEATNVIPSSTMAAEPNAGTIILYYCMAFFLLFFLLLYLFFITVFRPFNEIIFLEI